MTGVERLSPTEPTERVIEIIERDGGVILEDFLTPEVLEGLRADLLPILERRPGGRDSFAGDRTRRMSALFAHTRHCATIATHRHFLPVARHFISKPFVICNGDGPKTLSADVRIGMTQAIQIGPGQGAQVLHRDDLAFLWRHPTHGREGRVQIMVALSDFTAENGGTLVVPGSHTWGEDRIPSLDDAVPTEMKAGSALIFLGGTFHGGGANRTRDQNRTGLTMALDAESVRQEENMYLSLTRETVASYPQEIQRLLGWSMGKTHMGWVEIAGQMADPIHLLEPAKAF